MTNWQLLNVAMPLKKAVPKGELTWRKLNKLLPAMKEDEVLQLLEDEKKGAGRVTVIIRLHQRFCTLRMERERAQLFEND